MNFSSFLKIIEIQTKVASITPFYLGHYMSTTVIMFFLSRMPSLCLSQ